MANDQAEQEALVVHEDALDAVSQAASHSIDQLIWQGSAEVAKSVTLFGPGIVVLPLFGKVSGVDEKACLAYSAHPKRVARGGLMDRVDFESKFGQLDPRRLVDELAGGRVGLEKRLQAMSNDELQNEVTALQDWREKANGRLKTLEKRAAWAFLGMPAGSANQAAVKRAFKRKALELHPDKGGDAGRFQLLQEMKELLIIPTPKELEEQEKEANERKAEAEKAKEKEQEKAKRQKENDEDTEGDNDFPDFSSDSSYDVDEEFKKMFPKKKKKKKEKDEEQADGDLDLGRCENFNRDRHEAARRKFHRIFIEMWERAGKLAEEIQRADNCVGGEALRQLRKFIDRFANFEVSKLKDNDPKKAERIFRRFLEQGSEVLCAAGAVDPVATVSSVAMQVNYPLLAIAPSKDLQQRCNALLEAIESLPSIFNKFIMPADDVASARNCAAKEAMAAAGGKPLHFRLLVPNPVVTSKRPDGLELPGITAVEVDLPPGSTLGDLRAAVLQVCSGRASDLAAPRLFCGGRFVSGTDRTALADVEALGRGLPVQCLPSNRALRPRAAAAQAPAQAPAQTPAPARAPVPVPRASAEAFGPPPRAAAPAPAPEAAAPAEAPQSPARAGARPSAPGGFSGVTQDVLAALGLGEAKAAGAGEGAEAAERRAAAEADQKAEEDRHKRTEADGHDAEGQRCVGEDEDPWFDDFFSDAKKASDSKAERERQEGQARAQAERLRRQKEEEAELRRREEERAQRKAAQEQGKSSMEARLRAQKQAAEAKKKLEKEKKAMEAKKKAEVQQKERQAEGSVGKKITEVRTTAIVKAKEDVPVQTLQCRRNTWDDSWEHPCAGDKRPDGSAIFCYPCDGWISVGDPYDHRCFELHCEKVGHYGWID